METGFDNDRYLRIRSEHIRERISKFGDRPYLGFGGKLFDDYHISRVLPGSQPDSKLRVLLQLADQAEIVIAISAADIEKNKICGDLGITYDVSVLHLIQAFRDAGLYVGPVVITHYTNTADQLKSRLEAMGIEIYRHYSIGGYPVNVSLIVSEDGYDKNEYIETMRPLIIVTAPGPGSGKMAACLSQLYHENRRGVKASYAKLETFPIWNLPLNHPVNLAYETTTADLDDVNIIDPFHLEAYGKTTVSYSRDAKIFPVFSAMFGDIYGSCPYEPPTDTGVNMAGNCIVDDGVYHRARRQEIVHRWYTTMDRLVKGESRESEVTRIEFLIKQTGVTTTNHPVVHAALLKAEVIGVPATAIELPDGRIVTGKTSELLGVGAAVLLNAVKMLGDIPDEIKLISPAIIESVQALKINYLGSKDPCLHTNEILITFSVNAANDPNATKALEQLEKFRGCQVYTSVMFSEVDIHILNKLNFQLTSGPRYRSKKTYHREALLMQKEAPDGCPLAFIRKQTEL